MKVKNAIKKIAALGTGVVMVGATMTGALAALEDYPAPFVTEGVYDALIVVGEAAATSDVLGAIDISASLQAAAVTAVDVDTGGSTSISGDSLEWSKGSNILEIGENLSVVRQTLTDEDLDVLAQGSVSNSKGTTTYDQYIRLSNKTPSRVEYAQPSTGPHEDVVGDYLLIPYSGSQWSFEYSVEFADGFDSDILSTLVLDDIEDEGLSMLGGDYSVLTAVMSGGSSTTDCTDDITASITFVGGAISDILDAGQTKTYTLDGVDYEVTAVFISNQNPETVVLSINGETTEEMQEGETEVLNDGTSIAIDSILTNSETGVVEFKLGADKIYFSDTNVTDTIFSGTAPEFNNEKVTEGRVRIDGSITGSGNDGNCDLSMTAIYYQLALESDDDAVYVAPGESVRDVTDADILPGMFGLWDVRYEGLVDAGTTDLVFKNRGDTSYDLEFTNIEGTEYSFPLITNRGGTYKFGDNTKDTHLIEGFNITRNDYFVVSDDTDDTAVTKVLKYDSIDTASKKVTFTDLGDSSKPTGTYTTAVADGGSSAATVNIGGTTYNFNIFRQGSTYNLKFDLNGGGSVGTDDRPVIVTKGGGILYLMGTANQTQLGGSSLNVTQANNTNNLGFAQGNVSGNVGFGFRTMSKNIDDSTVGDLYVNWTVTNRTNNEVGLNTPNGTNMSALINHDGNDELNSAQDRYGTLIVYTNPSSSDQSEKIEITYPTQQLEAQVFAVGESYTTTTTEVGNAFVVNEIAVGAAVLDVDAPAVGSKPLIVVGGPSINTVAAELMGNPTQEEVLELFSAGKAVIKLYETDNALLVAGYEALETQGAARVLANYDEYELTGSEVEVVVPSLTDLSVTAVSSE